MTSAIDATKPGEGRAYTADQRANWASAKSEIEQLQAALFNTEISVFNYLTSAQIADVEAGVLSFDASTYIQAAIDYANGLISATDARAAILVRIPAGKYLVTASQIVVKAHVDIHCDGVIKNNLASTTDFVIWFKNKSHCSKLNIDANSQGGVQFGENGTTCDMRIENVRVENVGMLANQIGMRVVGEGFNIANAIVDGGRPAFDFGDGGTNSLYRVNARVLRAYNSYMGARMDKAEYINVGQLICDSCTQDGLVIDRSSEIVINDYSAFFNDAAPGTVFASGYAFDIGNNSAARNVFGVAITAMVCNTGGGIGRVSNSDKCNIVAQGHLGTLYSGNSHDLTSGITYGTGNGVTGFVNIKLPNALSNVGTSTFAERVTKAGGETVNFPITAPYVITNVGGALRSYIGQLRANKSADQNYNTTIVLANIADMTFAVLANEDIQATFFLSIGAALATTGIKVAVTGPAAPASVEYVASIIPDLYAAGNKGTLRAAALATTLDFTAATQATVGSALLIVMVRLQNGANAGNLTLQACQSTSSGTNLTIRKGSFGIANRVI